MASDPSWQTIRRIRTHQQVLIQIQQKILDGHLRVGDRLPSERELVAALGVSRASVREALRVLEAMGIVDAHVGSGPDAGSTVAGRSTEALSNLLRLHLALAQFRIDDLVDVRIQLECAAATRAAAHAAAADLDHLRELVDAMSQPDIGQPRFQELDTEFHIELATVSRNRLAADLMQALRDAVRTEMATAFAKLSDWPDAARRLTDEHLAILTAIDDGDGELAESRITTHLTGFYDVHLATAEDPVRATDHTSGDVLAPAIRWAGRREALPATGLW